MPIFNRRAQNIMEYTLLMAGAVALSIVALRQGGLVDRNINQSLDISVSGVECMALNTCYDPNGCPVTCGNGCCETHGETAGSCWADCECSDPAECDDGVYCNGVEECGGNQHCRYGPSLSVGTDAGLCVECDGGGGERAVVDDPDCGTIDCGGNNYFHHTGPTADATDVETCYLREFAAITSGRCDGMRKCKDPDSANCTAYGDNTEYFCDTCKYIATDDCTGTSRGGCSPSPTSSECGIRVCDLNDVACRDYHDVTRYCDGGGSCAIPMCDSYTDAANGTYVRLCTECDGVGAEKTSVDDPTCGPIICAGYNYYFQTGDESPTSTETCTYRSYRDVTVERCAAMGVCKTADTGICLGYDDSYPYSCGTCQYIAAGDCTGNNEGSCSNYAAGTDAGLCVECNGAGGEKAGADDTGCGVIDCDGLNFYSQSGEESSTGTEVCTYRNYADIETNQCEGMNDCKDANSPDCGSYGEAVSYSCGICQYIAATDCTGTTQGGCSNYAAGTEAQICAACDGSGAQQAVADDPRCGTIDCSGLDYYYSEVSAVDADVQTCFYRQYADITTDRCDGINTCKAAVEANCTESNPVFQYDCGVCKEIGAGACDGTTLGGCSNSNTSTTCGTKDCDDLDTKCRDYHDVTQYCDGAGGCTDPVCDSYTDYDTSTECGVQDCSGSNTPCRDYQNVTRYCDGAGSCGVPACDVFDPKPDGTYVERCTVCDGSGGVRAAADDGACAAVMCTELNYYTKTTAADPATGDDICYHREYVDISTDKCQALGVCKDKMNCANPTDVQQYTCGVCQYIADTDCTGAAKGGCSNTTAGTDTGLCAECNGIGGERAPADDAGCGTIDCSGLDYYYQIGSESPTGTETCLFRGYADITTDRCEGINNCKDANTSDCATYAETTQYACGTCQYIADTDCTGTSKGGCTNYDTSAVCGTKDCDTLDTTCRNYNDVTNYCDGYGSCANSVCDNSYTNAVAGTYVGVCAECDGSGAVRAAADDGACGTIMCTDLNYYTKVVSGTEEICYHREYINMNANRCEGVNDCKDKDLVDCTSSTDVKQYTCGTCQYITATDCTGTTKGSCSNTAAGTDTGVCAECDGNGSQRAPTDDTACGTIDCDGLDQYIQSGTESPTATETCTFRNYTDLTSVRCEGVYDCKDANTVDCASYTDTSPYTCGTCKYINASNCTGTTLGSCSNYAVGTDTGLCSECDGSGAQRMAADDAGCGTIGCAGMNYYYQSGTESATTEEICYYRTYANIAGNRCEGINDCKDADTSDCSSYSDGTQYTCGVCKYINASNCTGTTAGGCSNYASGTSCGGTSVCDGSGNCQPPCGTPPNYTNAAAGIGGSSYGDTRTVSCNSCYSGASTTITCSTGGTWSGSGPSCSLITCASPTSYDTASTDVTLGSGNCGNTRTVSCVSGYTGTSTTITCGSNGNWSGSMPSCTSADCGSPGTYTNATVGSGGTTNGSTRTVSCNTGYTGTSTTITCSSGTWTGSGPSCTQNCGVTPSFTNAWVSSGSSSQGSTRTVSCNTGYSGTATTITCSTSATWTGSGPTCTNNCGINGCTGSETCSSCPTDCGACPCTGSFVNTGSWCCAFDTTKKGKSGWGGETCSTNGIFGDATCNSPNRGTCKAKGNTSCAAVATTGCLSGSPCYDCKNN